MQWSVNKVPEQSFLNTAGWKYIVPQLYKKYPNDDMQLNITLTSPPIILVAPDKIGATVTLDMIIEVLDGKESIPVACMSMVSMIIRSVFSVLAIKWLFVISICKYVTIYFYYSKKKKSMLLSIFAMSNWHCYRCYHHRHSIYLDCLLEFYFSVHPFLGSVLCHPITCHFLLRPALYWPPSSPRTTLEFFI